MNVVAIIQARMGSTRVPGKVLEDICGQPMLARTARRVQRARGVDTVVVATTVRAEDDVVEELCQAEGWACYRGNETDLLDRYYQAAQQQSADVIVRITSDCPLIDPSVVDLVLQEFLGHEPLLDYASNINPTRTFPRGLDVEVVRFEALEVAWREDSNPSWREHVTPYIHLNPDRFSIRCIKHETDCSEWRWTVDTPQDLKLVRLIYGFFGNDVFTWQDARALMLDRPDWARINSDVVQKPI